MGRKLLSRSVRESKELAPALWRLPSPLFTELPRRVLLGNLHSYSRTPIRYRGVGKRA